VRRVAPGWLRKIVNVLSGALRFAVEDERLPSNPAARLKLPKPTKTRKRYLSHDQVAAIAQAIDQAKDGRVYSYGLVVLVLAYCGLRWGELSGLQISDLDLDAKHPRLTVKQTVVADKGYQRIEPPKDYEHRSIPIPAFLVGLLRAQIIGRSADAPVFYGIHTSTRLRNHVYRVGWFDDAAAVASPRTSCGTPPPRWP